MKKAKQQIKKVEIGAMLVKVSCVKLPVGGAGRSALARFTGEPLLFKGDDFANTDVTPARGRRSE